MKIDRGVIIIGSVFGVIAFIVCLFFLPPLISLGFGVFTVAVHIVIIGIVINRAAKNHAGDGEIIGRGRIWANSSANYYNVKLVGSGILYLTSDSLFFISHEKKPTLVEEIPLYSIKEAFEPSHAAGLHIITFDGVERRFVGPDVRDFISKICGLWDSTHGIFSYLKGELDCDCRLVKNMKDVSEAMEEYERLLELWKPEGCTPLIIVPGEMLCETIDEATLSKDEIIESSKAINASEFLNDRIKQAMPTGGDSDYDIMGEFANRGPITLFNSLINSAECDLDTRAIYEGIIIAKIPTANPWELAAWMPMGGWNECPAPAEQVAVFKYWYEKYGAIPAVVCEDRWDMYIERPPVTKDAAVGLALEQFGFCGDIVWQGVGKINILASTLMNSKTWYFWWD